MQQIVFSANVGGNTVINTINGTSVSTLTTTQGIASDFFSITGGFTYTDAGNFGLFYYAGSPAQVLAPVGSASDTGVAFTFGNGQIFTTVGSNGQTTAYFYDGTSLNTIYSPVTGDAGGSEGFGGARESETEFPGAVLGSKAIMVGGETSDQIIITDGTTSGTQRYDINTVTGLDARDFLTANGKVFFIGEAPIATGDKSSNTPRETIYSIDGNGNFQSNVTNTGTDGFKIWEMVSVGNKIYAAAGVTGDNNPFSFTDSELYEFTGSGLSLIKNITPSQTTAIDNMREFGSNILFEGNGSSGGRTLYVSNGTNGGTLELSTSLTSVEAVTVAGSKAFFFGTTTGSAGHELWVTDGTAGGTKQVIDLNPGSGSGIPSLTDSAIVAFGNEVYFSGRTGFGSDSSGLYKSDGTASGTVKVFTGPVGEVALVNVDGTTVNPSGPKVLINNGLGPKEGVVSTSGVSFTDRLGTSNGEILGETGGNERIDFGGGVDQYNIGAPSTGFTIETGTTVQMTNGSKTYELSNVERIAFSDGKLHLDVDAGEIAGGAYRVYQAAFNRTPDNDGLKFWVSQMDGGTSLLNVAGGFVSSQEFRDVYGSNVSNLDYISKLYENVLGRAGEEGGITFWTGQMASGARNQAQVLADFAESPENVQGLAATLADGYFLLA